MKNLLLNLANYPKQGSHLLAVGGTGSGKTNMMIHRILKWIEEGKGWVLSTWGHPEFGWFLAAMLLGFYGVRWFQQFVRIIDVGDFTKLCPTQFLRWSEHPDPFQRAKENTIYCSQWIAMLLRTRGMVDFGERRGTEQYALKLYEIGSNLKGAIPENELCLTLRKDTDQQKLAITLLAGTAIGKWLEKLSKDKSKDVVSMAESVIRLAEALYNSAAIIARLSHPPTFDLEEFLNEGGVTIIVNSRGQEAEYANITGTEYLAHIDLAYNNLVPPGMIGFDEPFNYGTFSAREARGLATLRAYKVHIELGVQTWPMGADNEQLRTDLNQNTDKAIFLQGDPKSADMAAAVLRPLRDSYKVHHKTKKQRHAGYSAEPRKAESKTKKDGKELTVTESHSSQMVSIIEEYEEDVYQHLAEQDSEMAGDLMDPAKMLPGTCFIAQKGFGLAKIRIPLVENTWVTEVLLAKKIELVKELNRQRPEMESPIWVETSYTANNETSGSSGSSNRSGSQRRGKSSKPPKDKPSRFRHKDAPREE